MDADTIVKLVLVFSVSISLLIICIQIARVIGGIAGLINDIRGVTKNFKQDYEEVRGVIKNTAKLTSGLASIPALFSFFTKMRNKE